MKPVVAALSALVGAGFGATVAAQGLPPFVQELIARRQSSGQTFAEIWRYRYDDQIVYFVPQSPLMNDSMSQLFSSTGELICMPDGGYFGRGDGKCPDFFTARSSGALVWGPRRARVQRDAQVLERAAPSSERAPPQDAPPQGAPPQDAPRQDAPRP